MRGVNANVHPHPSGSDLFSPPPLYNIVLAANEAAILQCRPDAIEALRSGDMVETAWMLQGTVAEAETTATKTDVHVLMIVGLPSSGARPGMVLTVDQMVAGLTKSEF